MMSNRIIYTQFILYVTDQKSSSAFYEKVLGMPPSLDVPGMTEFVITASCKLGLMPNNGIAKILGGTMAHPATGNGIPRCEIYLKVADAGQWYENAIKAGAKLISPLQHRDWGDKVCYFADPDGHVIAFAEQIN